MTVTRSSPMTDIPILDNDYWTALEILAEETGNIRDCMAQKLPWYPADGGQFAWAMRTYRNWHPENAETYLLDFPWPEPGEVPDIPDRYFARRRGRRPRSEGLLRTSEGRKSRG